MMPNSADKLMQHFADNIPVKKTIEILEEFTTYLDAGKLNFCELKLLAEKKRLPPDSVSTYTLKFLLI
jgi:hypothetical protein